MNPFRTTFSSFALLLSILVQNAGAQGDPRPAAMALTLDGAVRKALENNPAHRSARETWKAAKARVPQAEAWEDPKVSFEQTLGRLRRHVAVCLTEEKQRLSVARRSALLREPQRRWQEAVQRLDTNGDNLRRGAVQALNSRREKLRGFESVLKQHRPDQLLALRKHQLEALGSRMDALTDRKLQHLEQKLASCASCLRLVSPQATLERGYTITSSARGVILHSAEEAAAAEALVTRFADGKVESGGARVLPESSEG